MYQLANQIALVIDYLINVDVRIRCGPARSMIQLSSFGDQLINITSK